MDTQRLHLVFGGRLKDASRVEFADTGAIDIVGIYPNYAKAYEAWRGAAQATVDDAETRYFIAHLHRLYEPEGAPGDGGGRGKA